MTFTEIVSQIADDLNRTSTAAMTRIGKSVNRWYKQLCADNSIRTITPVLGVQMSTTIGSNQLVWNSTNTSPSTNVEKILRIYNAATTPATPLYEASVDEIQNGIAVGDPATRWAPLLMGASSVTVLINSTPATSYALQADVLANVSTLSGSNVPAFTEDFHDLLYLAGKADELRHMEKYEFADAIMRADGEPSLYSNRLGEFRLYLALSNHRHLFQGKNGDRPLISASIG